MNDKIQPEPEKKKRRDVQNEHNSGSDERKVKCTLSTLFQHIQEKE